MVSAEHGIGKLKAKYLNVMMGERYLNEMAEVKRAFDPKGILGRGNMFGLVPVLTQGDRGDRNAVKKFTNLRIRVSALNLLGTDARIIHK